MVVRTRIRAAVFQAVLWALAAASIGYFGYHGVHGKRGLNAHRSFDQEIAALTADLSRLEQQRKELEHRVNQFEPASVDRDLLDEEARRSLGWLHPNDRLIVLPQ